MIEYLNVFYSNIEETAEKVIVGIDEAGRGPVVGPMVYCLLLMSPDQKSLYKDSKKLSPIQRERFFKSMKNYCYIAVSPIYITTHMNGESMNLNKIAVETVKLLLVEAVKKCKNIETVFIDGLGNNEAYKDTLSKYFELNYIIESKADEKYPVVSGASIVAKVTRDKFVSEYKCGSGYPGDPNTIEWLKTQKDNFFGYPSYVRHSWKTIKRLIDDDGVKYALSGNLRGFFL